MSNQFYYFKELYEKNMFNVLLEKEVSVYWLKLRSISRKELMIDFCHFANINCANVESKNLFKHIYTQQPDEKVVDRFIEIKYQERRLERKSHEVKLISELYKLQFFDWGGLYQNNLERTIINNYVKKIKNFDDLEKEIEGQIHQSMKSYVLSSWFNHWTSILIEDIFKDHERVVPAIGLIKKVDFFINRVPFDLKVTQFPSGFMQGKRRELGLKSEIQELKLFARKKSIHYNRTQKDKATFLDLLTRFKESTDKETKKFLAQFNSIRIKIIKDTIARSRILVQWLYENQGERRFDATNRLFLVLIDEQNLEDSWKMKRNMELLKDKIKKHLDCTDICFKNMEKFKIKFEWTDGKTYSAFSDIIFICKNHV